MTATDVKDALRRRHPAITYLNGLSPGPWTTLEEWMDIDLLAVAAWTQPKPARARFERIGYEVKVSRGDYRSELLRPGKRAAAVAFCHEFYFATPSGLLGDDEKAFIEPEWDYRDFVGPPCPGYLGERCNSYGRRKTHRVRVPSPTTERWSSWDYVKCPTCGGKGTSEKSRVEREAPKLWIPRDVGLIEISGRGSCSVVRKAPIRDPSGTITDQMLAQLVRWASFRPDPRHAEKRAS